MANPEHLKILNGGAAYWNRWRAKESDVEPDLSGIILNAAVLIGVNFSHTRFLKSSIVCSELPYADFTGAFLKEVNFNETALPQASFRHATLTWANFSHANLKGADFSGAHVGWTTFGDNDLSRAFGLEAVTHLGPSIVGVETLYRSGGVIPEVFLRGCGLSADFITYMRSHTTKGIEFYSCFISYSSKDQEFAERLHADLQAKGVSVWYAPHDLPIGAKIRPAIDESIRLHDKLLLVLSETSVSSQWVEQEVETALAKEREPEGKTVLFPIRIDNSVMEIRSGWPALLKNTRNVGDFTRWKDHDSYQKALERLLRDLKTKEPAKPTYLAPGSLENRAMLSPRDTIRDGWKEVESSVIQAARHNHLVSEGERVDCGLLINQLHEMGKISEAAREDYFLLSKWHRNVAFDSFSSVEPQTAINFVSRARELQKALAVDTPPLP